MLEHVSNTNDYKSAPTGSIYFEYISDSTGIISNQNDYNYLYDLAFMDPLIAGPSVYSARVLLQLDPDTENGLRSFKINNDKTENIEFDFSLVPNPADETTQIIFNQSTKYKISVFNLNGQLLVSENGIGMNYYLNSINFEEGIYILKIESEFGIKNKKLSIIHK